MASVAPCDAVGDRILEKLARRVGRGRFDRYFGSGARLEFKDESLEVHVATPFYADWLRGRFGDCLVSIAREETGLVDLRVEWAASDTQMDSSHHSVREAPRHDSIDVAHAQASAHVALPASPPRRPAFRSDRAPLRHRLDDFIIGASNRLIVDAAMRLSDPFDQPGFSLLFVHGPCGVGKTHLLQGLANRYLGHDRTARVAYYTGEQFTNEYITAIRSGRIESFRKKLRRLELLCVDDVHFLSGKRATQSECLYTLDALELSGARIALASDAHPRTIAQLSDRLISRCLSGLVIEMPLPDRDTRMHLVEQLATRRGLRLERDCIHLIESHAGPSARDIEGALTRIDAFARLHSGSTTNVLVDLATVRQAMNRLPGPAPFSKPVSMNAVIDSVCQVIGIMRADLLGKSRHKAVVLARGLVVRVARELTTMSYPEIARAIGRGNHSTVITADQRVSRQIERGESSCGIPNHEGRTIADLLDLAKREVADAMSRSDR